MRRIAQYRLVFGLLPFAAMALYTSLTFIEQQQDGVLLALRYGVLAALTLWLAAYVIRRNVAVHRLPFIWAALLLLELIVSPFADSALGVFPAGSMSFAQSMSGAFTGASAFVTGTLAALWVFTLIRTPDRQRAPVEAPESFVLRRRTELLLVSVAFIIASFGAQVAVIIASGALGGNLGEARGAGLLGTTVWTPIVRLANYAALLSVWAAVHLRGRQRRPFVVTGVLALLVCLVMPAALHQRFGFVQAAAYFLFPVFAAARWPSRPALERAAVLWLPAILAGVVVLNAATVVLRGRTMVGSDYSFVDWDPIASKRTHLRHLWLLGEVMSRSGEGGNASRDLYGANPVLGDVTVFLPRALFPEKPVTSMEAVNGIMFGWRFVATDRGVESVYTPGILAQMYVVGGVLLMGPLAFLFTLGSLLAYEWAIRRTRSPAFIVVTATVWLASGWLAHNAVFNMLELPSVLLAVLLLKTFGIRDVTVACNSASHTPVGIAQRAPM